jgi:putative ABC transport system substrate-binding protein
MVRLGFLFNNIALLRTPFFQPFFSAFSRLGWREGIDYVVDGRGSDGDLDRAVAMARELVASHVNLIVATSTLSALAAKRATSQIPIVSWLGYPVEMGLAQSLARPGGNVTGVSTYASMEVWGKFIELLRELRPRLREVGVLWEYVPPGYPDGLTGLAVFEKWAKQMGVATRIWQVRNERDVDDALSAIEQSRVEAMLISTGAGIHNRRDVAERIGSLFVRRKLPAVADLITPAFERASCVLAYSPNVSDILERLSGLVDRVLRGANPAEVPFEQPSRFVLAVNSNAARAMGIVVPQSLLVRADRVIE